jgi:hypothetical protein
MATGSTDLGHSFPSTIIQLAIKLPVLVEHHSLYIHVPASSVPVYAALLPARLSSGLLRNSGWAVTTLNIVLGNECPFIQLLR